MSLAERPVVSMLPRSLNLSAAVDQAIDPMRLMQRVTDRTLEMISAADGVMVGLADERGVVYLCGAGVQTSDVGTSVDLHSSLSGLAVRTGLLQRSDDTSSDPRVDAEACRRLSVASLVCVPLRRREETLGVLAVNAKRAGAFSDADVELLRRLADFVSVVVGSACDLDRVRTDLLDVDTRELRAEDFQTEHLASRYVVSVLAPDTVDQLDRGRRIRAILDDERLLTMAFQPIVDLVKDEVVGVESLARFLPVPHRAPDRWFEEAHAAGLGVELELVAVARALAAVPLLPEGVSLSVNAGPETVVTGEFHDLIARTPAELVIIELTEHEEIADYPRLVDALQTLRRRGARIAIDDAGSGYSGLSHILKLAPDFIKLDRELVSGIDVDPVRRALAASLVAFAAETGAEIIAEGVESEDELLVLRELGLRFAQGFHLARPGPLTELALGQRWSAAL